MIFPEPTREAVAFEPEGVRIAGSAIAAGDPEAPLLACLHGGLYRGHYFDVPSGPGGPFMDLAAASGFSVVAFDRPG